MEYNTSHKQLELDSLIEFSQLISSKLDLKHILNNILLSIMGKMLISKGMVLLRCDEKNENIYCIESAKGININNVSSIVEIEFPRIPVFTAGEINVKSDFLEHFGFKVFFKIYFQNKYLGILCLGNKLNNTEFSKNEIVFIETMLNISSSAIENTIKFNEVKNLNSNLNNKIRQLKSLFELGKEFNMNFTNKENIIKLLNFTLLGNFGITDFVILSKDGLNKFTVQKDSKKFHGKGFDINEYFNKNGIADVFLKTQKVTLESENPVFKFLAESGFELYIPTIIKNELEYIICLGKKLNKSDYSDSDKEFLESLLNLSLISVQNSNLFQEFLDKQKIENELKIAREIQIAMLPSEIPSFAGYDIAGLNLPALHVGGDYFDVIKLSCTKAAIVIADVSGKGTPASLLMANIQSAVHSYLKLYDEETFMLDKVTEKINELIFENTSSDKFITFFWGILDTEKNEFDYINAGHNPPFLLKGNDIKHLSEGGFIIGILDSGINYDIGKAELSENDVIVFYTDGVTEAMNIAGEEYGEERLESVLRSNKDYPSNVILEKIKKSILEFSEGTKQYDDITLIVLKKN
ncbi:MAG: hypothetical protein HGGPFJEG_01133 [Ignavibacteria bacterium]|nr:hypothetical protein [Ignavibacteria bacterium]